MVSPALEIVFVDVDDTLVRSAGSKRIPIAAVVDRVTASAGKLNFENVYQPLVNAWALYDNSNGEPILLNWDEK
jgi:hypothetical protein